MDESWEKKKGKNNSAYTEECKWLIHANIIARKKDENRGKDGNRLLVGRRTANLIIGNSRDS